MSYYTDSTVYITGLAKPSADDAITSVYKSFSLCLIVDTRTDTSVDLCCTAVMKQTEDFIRFLIVGSNLCTETEMVTERIRLRFLAMVQKTLIAAYKDAQNRYLLAFPEKRNLTLKK